MQSEIEISEKQIDEFCRRWRVEELAVDRHSINRSPAAQPGLSVKFDPSAEWSFSDRLRMQREFQQLSGQDVCFRRRRLPARRSHHGMRVLYDA